MPYESNQAGTEVVKPCWIGHSFFANRTPGHQVVAHAMGTRCATTDSLEKGSFCFVSTCYSLQGDLLLDEGMKRACPKPRGFEHSIHELSLQLSALAPGRAFSVRQLVVSQKWRALCRRHYLRSGPESLVPLHLLVTSRPCRHQSLSKRLTI